MKAMDAEKKLCPFIHKEQYYQDQPESMGPLEHINCCTIDCMAWRRADELSDEDDDGYCKLIERRAS